MQKHSHIHLTFARDECKPHKCAIDVKPVSQVSKIANPDAERIVARNLPGLRTSLRA